MINVSAAFHESFKSDLRNVKVRITKGTTVYTEKDINALVYEGLSLVGNSFSIGSVPSNSVKIIFSDVITTFKELDELKVEIGIQVGASVEWCPLGIFYLSERADVDHNEQRTTIECLDKMVFMEGLYESKLAYPAMIKDVALEIANLAGVEVNPASFSRLRTQTISKIVGLTHRQAIGIIAQFESGYATFDRLGKLDIRQLNNTAYIISPDEYFSKGLKKNDLKYALGGISVKVNDDTTLSVGQSKGAQIELENNVMTQTLLDSIYEGLKLTNYYPFTLDWRGNPAVEVGDWVEMTDTKGNSFKGPILSYKLIYDGGLKAEISADTEVQTSTTTAYRPPLSQKLEQIGAAIKNAQGNFNYYGLTEPPYPKEGDLWFKPNGPEEELWQYVSIDGVLQWKLIISTADIAKIEKEIEKIIAENALREKEFRDRMDLTDKEIAAFEDKLLGLDFELDNIVIGSISPEVVMQAIKNAGFSQSVEDIRNKVNSTSDSLETTIGLVGNNGVLRYNKNRTTLTELFIPFGIEEKTISHNGDGFEVGESYTVSFSAHLIQRGNSRVIFNFEVVA